MTRLEDWDEGYGGVASRYYDAAYESLRARADVDFYRELAVSSQGPVLELGCGTGRVLIEIANRGIPTTGVDASSAMLRALGRKRIPRTLRLVHARMQDFDLGDDRFTLIFSAFRAFQHLLEVDDQLACLERVRRHLAPGGTFAFDVFAPVLDRDRSAFSEQARFPDGDEEVVRYDSARVDFARQLTMVEMRYERWRGGEKVGEESASFELRHFYRFELEHLLRRAGFADLAFYGDFDRSPFDGRREIVVLARA